MLVGIQSRWLEIIAMLSDSSFSGNTSGVGIRSSKRENQKKKKTQERAWTQWKPTKAANVDEAIFHVDKTTKYTWTDYKSKCLTAQFMIYGVITSI